MVILSVDVRAAGVLQALRNGEKRTAFAIVNALNGTIKEVQSAERTDVLARFTVRKRDFLLRQAAVIKGAGGGSGFASATQGRFEARVAVGQKPRLLLGQFERGGARQPVKGRRAAVPLIGGPARPTFRAEVPAALTYRHLAFHRRGRRILGKERTFVLRSTARQPEGGVFQRVGRGRAAVRLLYPFVAGQQLDRRLRFLEVANRVARAVFPARLGAQVRATLHHHALRVVRGFGR
jgi:hypothetical protein